MKLPRAIATEIPHACLVTRPLFFCPNNLDSLIQDAGACGCYEYVCFHSQLQQIVNTPRRHADPWWERQFGRKAQISNITAAKTVADIIRSCLGPKAMLKMLLDPMGGIVLTNDGHAILREIEVAHPAAKSMIELSRTQDEEVGDGTTTVIILGRFKLAETIRT